MKHRSPESLNDAYIINYFDSSPMLKLSHNEDNDKYEGKDTYLNIVTLLYYFLRFLFSKSIGYFCVVLAY